MRCRILMPASAVTLLAALVVTLAGLSVAQAAPPAGTLGTLTMTPASGLDVLAPIVRTSAGCTADSDAYTLQVYGPGAFAAGYLITSTGDAGFSRSGPFDIFFGASMKDAATDLGTTLVAGDYPVVASCIDSFLGDVKGTFTLSMIFTSPTQYTTGGSMPTTTSPGGSTSTTAPTTTPATTTTAATTTTTTTTPGSGTQIGVTIPTLTSVPTTTPPTGSGGLASTGAEVGGLVVAGVLLLWLGALLVMATSSRRTGYRG